MSFLTTYMVNTLSYEGYPVKMEVFFIIIVLICFGIEEIFHEQHASEKRIKENMKLLDLWNGGKRR